MARPIEEVVNEAQSRLEQAGGLDIEAWAVRYPEHTAELRPLLTAMVELYRERQWLQAEEVSRSCALGLFQELVPTEGTATLGNLFARARQEGVTTRLPGEAVEKLSRETAPVDGLDNMTLKQIADRIAVRFDELLKEVKRLRSLQRLWSSGAAPVMTRHREESSEEEQQALIEKVKRHSRKEKE